MEDWVSFFASLFVMLEMNRTWIQEIQLHDSFSLMEKSRSSNIQEMKFALVHKSSDSFCNTLKLKDKTFAGFQIARMYFCLKVQKHEEKIERDEKCRRENILISKCQILILHLSILQFTVPKQTSVQNKTKKITCGKYFHRTHNGEKPYKC